MPRLEINAIEFVSKYEAENIVAAGLHWMAVILASLVSTEPYKFIYLSSKSVSGIAKFLKS